MALRIYNTLTSEKELFEPVVPGQVGIYLCGPTVYKPAHIGHAVGPIIFDVVKRYLTFKGYKVTWVVNITDVDDKLIVESAVRGLPVPQIARELEKKYFESLALLGVDSIDNTPRASEHISDIIKHINHLIERDIAYVVEGDVYFDVSKDEDYGKLSNRRPEEQFAGTRDGLIRSAKRNPGDFALWKAAKPEEPAEVKYDSPWGSGRPGWHIECSAMAMRYLGQTFDIHGGGMDLKFPHHENEIAQAECATDRPFAKYWMHNGLTRFNTKKISKSDPEFEKIMNSLQLSNLLAQHSPELLRFLIISSHYRSPIDFSDATIQAAKSGLGTLNRLMDRLQRCLGADPYAITATIKKWRGQQLPLNAKKFVEDLQDLENRFLSAMDDDFNTAGAIGNLFEMAGVINRFIDESKLESKPEETARDMAQSAAGTLVTLAQLLGLLLARPVAAARADDGRTAKLIELLVQVREMARTAKQFPIADLVRQRLTDLGIVLEDHPGGTRWRID